MPRPDLEHHRLRGHLFHPVSVGPSEGASVSESLSVSDVADHGDDERADSQLGETILEQDDFAARIRCFSRVRANKPESNQDKH
jgi:hypothetical protein